MSLQSQQTITVLLQSVLMISLPKVITLWITVFKTQTSASFNRTDNRVSTLGCIGQILCIFFFPSDHFQRWWRTLSCWWRERPLRRARLQSWTLSASWILSGMKTAPRRDATGRTPAAASSRACRLEACPRSSPSMWCSGWYWLARVRPSIMGMHDVSLLHGFPPLEMYHWHRRCVVFPPNTRTHTHGRKSNVAFYWTLKFLIFSRKCLYNCKILFFNISLREGFWIWL